MEAQKSHTHFSLNFMYKSLFLFVRAEYLPGERLVLSIQHVFLMHTFTWAVYRQRTAQWGQKKQKKTPEAMCIPHDNSRSDVCVFVCVFIYVFVYRTSPSPVLGPLHPHSLQIIIVTPIHEKGSFYL